jgi:hypothetical protein
MLEVFNAQFSELGGIYNSSGVTGDLQFAGSALYFAQLSNVGDSHT